ncbi:MAG: amidohydrolase [Rhodospirillaceae bacterium TMED8]|nr:amidohydrolase [Magnetovibrio sp.]OUT53271.1 MAG: amidohydrolase [Rhodospirillaceae bacterium TMED8]|tara:strand:+ start:2546 stop:3379 length:834 start_codon:yes stop_codon:yes gene_type:complete
MKIACAQTTSGPDVDTNIKHASDLIRRACDAGADLVGLPEVVNVMDLNRKALAAKTFVESKDVTLAAMRELSRETGVWILVGSLVIKHDHALDDKGYGKFANRSFLIDDTGQIRASYDKIHMFDVDLDGGESYRESKAYEPGNYSALVKTPWGNLGMSICYDLRFPHLYRDLAHAGADLFSIPSAFTRRTGRAHWHVLMRARAVENAAYVFAPAQCGAHGEGRETYGHSLIVDPWGEVLADGGESPGVSLAEIDISKVQEARHKIPSLTHDRHYSAK